MLYAYDSGGTRRMPAAIYVYDSAGNRQLVKTAYAYDSGGTRRLVFAALSASAANVSKLTVGDGSQGTVLSDPQTVTTVSGGSGNYSYSYSRLSTSSGNSPTIFSGATANNPRFTATVAQGTPSVSTWRVTVTDTTYSVTATADFTVTLEWETLE